MTPYDVFYFKYKFIIFFFFKENTCLKFFNKKKWSPILEDFEKFKNPLKSRFSKYEIKKFVQRLLEKQITEISR